MTQENRAKSFCIRLAGVVIRIEPMYDFVREYCRDYIVEEQGFITIRTTPVDIAYERTKSEREAVKEGHPAGDFTDAYLETLAVYRKIAEELPKRNIILCHGSVIAVDGEGYLFTAKSGTGKSTHTRLWREHFGDRAVMVNDDKPLLEIRSEGVVAYGTPWCGKHGLNCNIAVPLKGICVLSRAETNRIERVSPRAVYGMLLQQIYRPADGEKMLQTMKLVDRLMEKTSFYHLGCNMNPEAAVVAYEGMNGK